MLLHVQKVLCRCMTHFKEDGNIPFCPSATWGHIQGKSEAWVAECGQVVVSVA